MMKGLVGRCWEELEGGGGRRPLQAANLSPFVHLTLSVFNSV